MVLDKISFGKQTDIEKNLLDHYTLLGIALLQIVLVHQTNKRVPFKCVNWVHIMIPL